MENNISKIQGCVSLIYQGSFYYRIFSENAVFSCPRSGAKFIYSAGDPGADNVSLL